MATPGQAHSSHVEKANAYQFFLQQDMYAVADGPGYSHSGAAIVGRSSEDAVGLKTVENLAMRMAQAVKR